MLTKLDVLELMKSSETFRVEKTVSTTNIDKFSEAICAFANDMPDSRRPGYLLVGVEDDGSLCGLEATDALMQTLSSLRTNGNILPIPSLTVQPFHFPEGDVVVVEVMPSELPPVRYKGRTCIRTGPRKDYATQAEENQLAEKKHLYVRTFDLMPCCGATINDIDVDLFKREYLHKAVAPEILEDDSRTIKDILSALRLFDRDSDCPTNACVLLFGKDPQYFFPGAYIQHVQFDGLDNAAEILNENRFDGNLVSMLPRLQAFVDTSIVRRRPVAVSSLQERFVYDFPQWAIRELLMNAVMHRDYQSGNAPTKFYIYSDRLEIINTGGLYGNARPENFPDVNDYRNPIIAEALRVLGYVNKFNRGISRVQKELLLNGNGKACFNVDKITVFSVSVTNSKVLNVSDNVSNVTWSKEEFESIKLSDKSLRVMSLCADSKMTKKEMLSHLGVTYQTNNVKGIINPLLYYDLITPILADKEKVRGVHYIATLKGHAFHEWLKLK